VSEPSADSVREVGDEFWRAVEVVGPEPRDTFGIAVVFDPGLEHALEGHKPHERQRREQDQAERVKRRADTGGCRDQPEGNQSGRHRAEEHGRPAGRFRGRRGPRSLQGEMFGGHEGDRGRPWFPAVCPGLPACVAARSSTSFRTMVAGQLSQQEQQPHHWNGTGEIDDGRHICGLLVRVQYQGLCQNAAESVITRQRPVGTGAVCNLYRTCCFCL
jgi:hypothetical protein